MEPPETQLQALQPAIIPEIAAAVAKLMSNKDLVLAAAKIRNVTRCRNTMGERGVLGIRVQPNHPADDIGGILLAAFEGLLYGCGDAVIGVNPATDSVETVRAILSALNRLIDALRNSDADLLSGAYHHPTGRARSRRACRPSIPVGRRHGSGQPQLRHHPGHAARRPRTAFSSIIAIETSAG